MNHDRLRRKIIETAAGCFLKYGIKNTSMNFVSEVLHISKRTLYQFFSGKCDLLEACVAFRLEASRKRIERQCEQSCPIEAIVCMNYGAYAFSRMFYPAFRFFENTLLAVPSASCDEGRQAEAYSNAILTYLAGICTDEGRKRLNNILVEIQYEDEDNSI